MNGKRKTIVIKLKNHKIKPDHRTDSPSQRGPGGVVTELVECVGCSFLIPHSSFIILSGCVGCSISIHQ
jgi:hypothetical protein